MHGPLEVNSDQELFRSFAVSVQRMAFYAGIFQKNRFTISLEDAREYAHLLPQVLVVERRRLDSGGYPRRLTLEVVREMHSKILNVDMTRAISLSCQATVDESQRASSKRTMTTPGVESPIPLNQN